MSESPTSPQEDALFISDIFLQGDVRAGLERMRKRLLDLTGRNRLLNFPQRPSKTSLRTVDELPDELFAHLVNGRDLVFTPVPRPRGIPVPAEEPGDEDGLPLSGPGATKPRYPSAKDHAERLGLATSFDLPQPSAQPLGDRHTDREIQTLHYPDDLEVILRKINSAARLAIEETGSNMLYLIFGFLEWYEADNSEQARFAPLLLLPVALEKGEADNTGSIRYSIRHSGEDVAANVSLHERLKRDFGLELPPLADDDTPEKYFARLAFLTARYPRWRVRRQITLALLSFGKILMYRDLDPDTWPTGSSPAEHERITEFFRGIQRDSITFADDYQLDDANLRHRTPMLVDEADSSQHSALIDALAGKNLVIEGPPGTGKSQTITNLIASALAAGKTVLFISDKLAALEVVRNRLDKVGLGTFCLELHSHKAQKRQILDDVDQRLHAHRSFRDPADLDAKLSSMNSDKAQLSAYVKLINQPFGALGRTLYDIIWSARRQRAALPFSPELVEGVAIHRASTISPPVLADFYQEAVQFATHLGNVLGSSASVHAHPWFGISNAQLTFTDTEILASLLATWVQVCQELSDTVSRANDEAGIPLLGDSPAALARSIADVRSLPDQTGDIVPQLLPALKRQELRARVKDFIRWVVQYRRTIDAITDLVGSVPKLTRDDLVEIGTLAHRGQALLPKAMQLGDLTIGAETCHLAVQEIDRSRLALDQFNTTLQADLPLTKNGATVAEAALAAIQNCPVGSLHLRHPGLDPPAIHAQLESTRVEADGLQDQRDVLARRLDLTFAPSVPELRSHVVATANPQWWSVLFRDYRAARRAYAVMVRDGRFTPLEMRDGFRRLHDFAVAEHRFSSSPVARNLAGPSFAGIDSPYAELCRLSSWRTGLGKVLASFGPGGATLASHIWCAAAEQLESLHDDASSSSRITDTLQAGLRALAGAEALHIPGVPNADAEWEGWRGHLQETGEQLQAISDWFGAHRLTGTLAIARIPELTRLLTELGSLAQLINSAPEIRDVLGSHYQGAATDLEKLARTVGFFDSVSESPVSQPLKTWLFDKDVARRLQLAHHSAASAGSQMPALAQRWQAFTGLTAVTEAEWLQADAPADLTFGLLIARARRALDRPDLLPAWLDYLRARKPLSDRGLEVLVRLAEDKRVDADAVVPGVAFLVLNSLVREAFGVHSELARFSGLSHEQVRRRFAKLDRECIELYRRRVARLIDDRQIPAGLGHGSVRTYTERHLLDHEISKQRAHLPVRQLLLRAGRALQALKPCFMMGPMSVAQYLTPGALTFDLVVMDEASQLRPEDALGAISRARQIVVVGDRMQLPPTSFFDRIGDESADSEEDAAAMTEAESILDIASATYKPSRMLRWHYRSRHGSLIAFSNKEFYRGRLVVFPSPVPTSPTHGVKLVHVRDGVYESSKNVIEARRVANTALKFMGRQPSQSLGIVAMNVQQRELIEDLLESAINRSESAQRYVGERASSLEPFFVKNLENVQGDERDVIYISSTYGRSPGGQVFQRFGPINGPTGHRRLNVLFTRARHRVVLFSSMLAEDILATSASSWGVRALKGYLHYAQTGVLETASFSGREPDSDFELEVADALRARGYNVVAQVGIAGYFIDLAVRHPRKPDAFLLGIECDGLTYHSGLSARDRDRLRQQVLEGLGWNIHRIWSTDWFKQPATEVDRVLARIDQLLRAEDASAAAFPQGDGSDFEIAGGDAYAEVDPSTSDFAWEGEAAVQPITVEDARRALESLSSVAREEFPDVPSDASILRPEMVDALLRTRPASRDGWLRHIPFDLRMATDGTQASALLPRILEIMAQLGS